MNQAESPQPPAAGTGSDFAVHFSIEVAVPIEQAFRVFTDGIDSWWPRNHRIGEVAMAAAILEPRPGGRWYELGVDGSECDWGVVLVWDPPRHLALSWQLDGEFHRDADATHASRVDVRFEARGEGTTRVVLEHTGLDHHGTSWQRVREGISRGWPADLLLFKEAAEARSVT